MTDEYDSMVSFKLPTATVKRIERYTRSLNDEVGHQVFSRSHALRSLVEIGLYTSGFGASKKKTKKKGKARK